MVISWIFNSTRDMWVDLQERFSQRNVTRIYELKKEIFMCSQGSMTVAEYHTKLKGLWNDLDTYQMYQIIPVKHIKKF